MEMSLRYFHFNNTEVYKNCSQKIPPFVSKHIEKTGTDSLSKG